MSTTSLLKYVSILSPPSSELAVSLSVSEYESVSDEELSLSVSRSASQAEPLPFLAGLLPGLPGLNEGLLLLPPLFGPLPAGR